VTGRSHVWVGLRLDYGRSPHAYVNHRLQVQLEAPDDEQYTARNMLSL
jgi:hypothetical protein